MTKTVSVNILGRSKDLTLDQFIEMYTNEIKSLRYQLIVRVAPDSMEIIQNKKKLEDKLNKALKDVELCARHVFMNENVLQTLRSK